MLAYFKSGFKLSGEEELIQQPRQWKFLHHDVICKKMEINSGLELLADGFFSTTDGASTRPESVRPVPEDIHSAGGPSALRIGAL